MTSGVTAAIWLIAGGAMQRLAAEKIKAMGYALILTDGSPSCAVRPLADAFVHLDTFDIAGNTARANGSTGSVIVEELLVPRPGTIAEQSVETVWYDGEMRWLNWVDRLFRKDFDLVPHPWNASNDPYQAIPWAVELGHLNPADHD